MPVPISTFLGNVGDLSTSFSEAISYFRNIYANVDSIFSTIVLVIKT